MALEDSIAALVKAVEENTKATVRLTNVTLDAKNHPAAAPAEAGEKPAEPKKADKKPKGPARDDVVKALKEYAAIEGKEAAIAIIKDHGAESVSDLDPDKYQAVIDATASR